MNMYGDYSIYFLNIFGSFESTFVAYLVGVLGTLILGFLFGIFLDRFSRTKKAEIVTVEEVADDATDDVADSMTEIE